MYLSRKMQRWQASLDPHESNLRWYGPNRFGREKPEETSIAVASVAKAHFDATLEKTPGNLASSFRHSGWHHDRNRVNKALAEAQVSHSQRQRFADCGRLTFVLREREGQRHYKLAGNYCRNRWCVPCGTSRSRAVAKAMEGCFVATRLRFVTLTLRSSTEPLTELIERLYVAFRKLQRSQLWYSRVDGGIAFLEVKYSEAKGGWHPHLHVIVKGKYLPQKPLSQLWFQITGDSFVVDVRAVKQTSEAFRYVTKYASKPTDASVLRNPSALVEAIKTLQGRRTIIPFGEWRQVKLRPTTEPSDYELVGTLEEVLRRCGQGESWALNIYADLRGVTVRPSDEPPECRIV